MWLCNPGTRGPVHFPVPRVFSAIPPRVASAPRGGAGTELGRNPRPSEFGARAPSVTIGASREFGARAPSVTIGALPDRNAAGKVVFGGFRVQIWRKLGVPCRARARNGPGARGAPAGARKGPCRARNPFRAPARNNSEPGPAWPRRAARTRRGPRIHAGPRPGMRRAV